MGFTSLILRTFKRPRLNDIKGERPRSRNEIKRGRLIKKGFKRRRFNLRVLKK